MEGPTVDPSGEGAQAEVEELSERWLTDLRQVEGFTPRDEALLQRVRKAGAGAVGMFANQQRLREKRLASAKIDIIEDQLRMIRDVFG